MSNQDLSFLFKIDSIRARPGAPELLFSNGHYKPPVKPNHYVRTSSTGWYMWTMNGVYQVAEPSAPFPIEYSTSIFYDSIHTNRFLFHPDDCQTVDISAIEQGDAGERWGWQGLCFTHNYPDHCVLDHDGEHDLLCGRGVSYIPHLLPSSYQSLETNERCMLSGKMSLLLALTAFSCPPSYMIHAISYRLNIREGRWDHVYPNWGTGRNVPTSPVIFRTDCLLGSHGRGLVVHIKGNQSLSEWENGYRRPLLM